VTSTLEIARRAFPGGSGYLDAATMGIPPVASVEALADDLALWSAGRRDASHYGAVAERARAAYARLVRASIDDVAIGGQASVMAALAADAVPDEGEILVVDGDFTSIVYPFLVRHPQRTRSVPLTALADEIGPGTAMVVFSLVQSATGEIAPAEQIRAAAAAVGALTVCDLTQAAGVHPVDARDWSITLCHAYKWLCSPRGVGLLTVDPSVRDRIRPLHAGWYAGDDVWHSIYGPDMQLASSARRFDISPAWQAFVGAAPAIELFASLDTVAVHRYTSGLADRLLAALEHEPRGRSIITFDDPTAALLAAVRAAGLRASGRDGRVRLAFHVWNDDTDVLRAADALRTVREARGASLARTISHGI
jgi:selenocysteine lyase/cysteine desulfurase